MYSPAAMFIAAGARSRANRSPNKSSDVAGSSNHWMSPSAQLSTNASACFTDNARDKMLICKPGLD